VDTKFRGRVTVICRTCATPFIVSRYEAEVRGRTFCGVKCRSVQQRIAVPPRDDLEALYSAGLSVGALARRYQVSKGTISAWLKTLAIPTRPANTALRSGRRRPRARSGRRETLGGLYVRSSWEANYALILNYAMANGLIEHWEYEPDVFEFPVKRGTRWYCPDFKVFRPEGVVEYHEVKGHMDQPSRTKLKRMKKYYPQVKIRLVDAEVYHRLERQYATVLVGWEGCVP
jgi:hypothetical protein